MATITVYYFLGGVGSAAANREAIVTGFAGTALAFSGASGPNTNITVGEFNTESWIITDSVSPTDAIDQIDNWQWQSGDGSDTAAALNDSSAVSVELDLAVTTSCANIGRSTLGFNFNHTVAVNANPVNLWSGAGDSIELALDACDMKAFDVTLATGNPAKTWVNIDFNGDGAKVTSSAHTGTTKEDHWWGYGICLNPTDVGTRTHNGLKFEITYF